MRMSLGNPEGRSSARAVVSEFFLADPVEADEPSELLERQHPLLHSREGPARPQVAKYIADCPGDSVGTDGRERHRGIPDSLEFFYGEQWGFSPGKRYL